MTAAGPPRPNLVLNVGITGHRAHVLSDPIVAELDKRFDSCFERLTRAVQGVAGKWGKVFSDTPPKLKLHTALATGADQLAATAAQRRGYQVRALLPFPVEEYERDFTESGEHREFCQQLDKADGYFALPGDRRDEEGAYVMVGKAVIAAADILIAVWDGHEGNGPGGTAHVVDLALRMGVPVREGFLRETSSSSVSQVSTSSSGLSRSLTEAESYTREARRAEEMASRLENQASWYEANSAAGTLNLSQAYREWGMAEIEANRDYYGPVRFDDIEFQMSARGQQLQSRFVDSYADRLQDDIEADLSLPDFAPVSRPGIGSAGQVRARGAVSSSGGPSMPDAPDLSGITDEVERVRRQGRGRIGSVRGYLDGQTEGATGASEEAADAIKEWRRP